MTESKTTLENQIAACLNVKRKSADYYRDEDGNLYKVTRNGWKRMKKAGKCARR